MDFDQIHSLIKRFIKWNTWVHAYAKALNLKLLVTSTVFIYAIAGIVGKIQGRLMLQTCFQQRLK